jgi:hypothetical protein
MVYITLDRFKWNIVTGAGDCYLLSNKWAGVMGLQTKDMIILIIAGYAALVSTSTLAWNIFIYSRDSGKIKINGFYGYLHQYGVKTTEKKLNLEFVNSGKKPIIITSFCGRLRSRNL